MKYVFSGKMICTFLNFLSDLIFSPNILFSGLSKTDYAREGEGGRDKERERKREKKERYP